MDSKKVIETLIKIAQTQQKAIHKLAQQHPAGGAPAPTPAPAPLPMPVPLPDQPRHAPDPKKEPAKNEARAIINALPAPVKSQLVDLQVQNGIVTVKWKAPVDDDTFNAVVKTVQTLKDNNTLFHPSYKVVEAS